ncbi:serine/arginine repetitive matrix protein 2 [Ostrinia furnacalis]|uniref:serine/arginine repetitive matrix protein 2 n=1 Tax=Ostrinia furnacalis TaxID=93504 RepID=UPI00103ECF42|nr:serine/arginine repetitive matrix protein 2 [Ostrinia furnacalis]XP_028157454.1 serine/arginine repetitive matrix protein 2 [Ostrinia furnacalis]
MLSDESSSDSETGRFKCRSKPQDDSNKSRRNEDSTRSVRGRPENERFSRDFEKSRNERDRFDKHARDRDRSRYSRNSPSRRNSPGRRRHSPIRRTSPARRSSPVRRSPLVKRSSPTRRTSPAKRISPVRRRNSREDRRSHERPRHEVDSRSRAKPLERGDSREKSKLSRPRTARSPERKRDMKEEILRNITVEDKYPEKVGRSIDLESISPDHRSKRSEIYRPPATESRKRKSESPIIVEEHSDPSDEVQPGSYYSLIPAVVKEKSEESSEIDSSDDEKLRAKLLNLEKELHKSKRKKHKKKHKKRHSKSGKESEQDTATVEVSSTTDIPSNTKAEELNSVPEVSSTQKNSQKESGEEGEIISDDDSQEQYEIDPNDLRHKLKRSVHKSDSKRDVCGPALPPHLDKHSRSKSPVLEGPALPPHLDRKPKHIGPSIPENMRKVLSERDPQEYVSSDEDMGIGPLPSGSEEKWSDAHRHLEERALDMKIRKMEGHSLDRSNVKSREQWMLELPEGKAKYLGLEARSFRAKEGPDMSDRSSWTDTPEEKARKAAGIAKEEDSDAALQREARARAISSRDEQQEMAVKKHKKKHKRDESLLDMHQKKLKKKKKKDEKDDEKKERRPFSRDVDLQVNRFDEAQKRSIIKKAQGLDSRFSRGEAKYL